jgi:tetratricopeptide (TPR) repeat protein
VYYLTTGNYRSAVDDLTASIDFAKRAGLPEIYNLYAYRGLALENLEQYVDAIDDFNLAISLCSRPNYYLFRGRALEALGKTEDASADLRRAGTANGLIDWERGRCE